MFDELILVEENSSGRAGFCWYCDALVKDAPFYISPEGNYYFHKECGDLPEEMVHEVQHPGHILRLHKQDPWVDLFKRCSICRNKVGTYYECSDCDDKFILDVQCAVKSLPLSHNCHPQHPLLANFDIYEHFHCAVCNESDTSGISYQCNTCAFRAHQKCVASRKIKLPVHTHELEFICYTAEYPPSKKPVCCQFCREELEFAFHCATCNVSFHTYSCRAVSYPSHDHPLALIEEQRGAIGADVSGNCYGCGIKISLPYYACFSESCDFLLHKCCADLPDEVKHHLHPGHALKLEKERKSDGDYEIAESSICNVCHVPWEGFSYSCSTHQSCSFSMDVLCAMKTTHLKYKFHEHPLFSSPTKASSACRACNKDSEGPSYQCTTCRFWVHQQCASAQMIVARYDLHPHKLKLNYSLTPKENTNRFRCHVCRKDIKLFTWAYQCAVGCGYFTHVHDCSDPNRMIEEIDPALAVHLPVANEFVSLETLFFMNINRVVAKGSKAESQDGNGGEHTRKMLFLDPYETCDKCSPVLSPPCKNCTLCKYFLPKSPAELRDPSLFEGYISMLKDAEKLEEEMCNGFGINVLELASLVKISSSVLPCYVKHEGHNHVLSTTCFMDPAWCNSCDRDFTDYGFICNVCDFTLCTYCALLPRSVSHEYEKEHGFKLTYYSIEDVEEYVCEICEGDIRSSWFYHCVECDQSIHPYCIWKIFITFGSCVNRYWERGLGTLGHDLVMVPTIKFPSLGCKFCDQDDTSLCSYSVSGKNMNAHVQCISRGEMDRWPDERSEVEEKVSLLRKQEESSNSKYEPLWKRRLRN